MSRARAGEAVLDFAEASQRVRSRAPRGQPNNTDSNSVTTGFDEALSPFFGCSSYKLPVCAWKYTIAVACALLRD
jgi:hypothetical protein